MSNKDAAGTAADETVEQPAGATAGGAEGSDGEPDEGAVSEPPLATDDLRAQLDEANAKLNGVMDQLLRTRAEMDNLRKRTERELENAHKYALERFALELLPVQDSLELGLAASLVEGAEVDRLREGTELTLKILVTALEKFGIRQDDPQGAKFDPERHQAMATQPSEELEPGYVVTVYQKGYTLNDRLLRPALVIVSATAQGA